MLDPRSVLLTRLADISDLPTLPAIILRLEDAARNPANGAKEIAEILETDPAIVANLLRLANSAYYRSNDYEVKSVRQAVTRLGLGEIRRVCLALSVMKLFVHPSAWVDHGRFWRHSLTVANATQTVASHLEGPRIDLGEAYTAGLLHEIGALILDQFFERLYALVMTEARRAQRPIHLVEQEFLRTTHAEIGALLLERWGLPASLTAVVRHHHDPSSAPEEHRRLCELVHVTDHVCSSQGNAGPGEEYVDMMHVTAWEDLGLEVERVYDLIDEINDDVDRTAMFMALAAA